jgi:hypothetical protein
VPPRHPCERRGPVTLHRVPTPRRIIVGARLQTEPGTRQAPSDDDPHLPTLRHPCAGRGPVTLHRVPTSRRINVRARLQTEPGTRHARPDDKSHPPPRHPCIRSATFRLGWGAPNDSIQRRFPRQDRDSPAPRAAEVNPNFLRSVGRKYSHAEVGSGITDHSSAATSVLIQDSRPPTSALIRSRTLSACLHWSSLGS